MTSPPAASCDDSFVHSKRFRFKSTSSAKASYPRSRSPSSRSRHHHRHHHRSKRRKTSPLSANDPSTSSVLDPESAFRESLFDALADDEGAAFWEGVYGQPIHTYPRPRSKQNQRSVTDDPAESENVNTMTDEEYVTYVRAKMWQKSHQHILEERRRDEERSRRKKLDEEGRRLEKGVEEALRRGGERRQRARWKGRWSDYSKAWESFAHQAEGVASNNPADDIRKRIPWPVLSGEWRDVNQDEVERFFKHAPHSGGGVDDATVLKMERVRWHPDKVQQRARTGTIDEETMRTVTAVFQIIDRIWSKTRSQ